MSYFPLKSRMLVAALISLLSVSAVSADDGFNPRLYDGVFQQSSNISGLIGRTDADLNLYVIAVAPGAAGQSSNIGGLVGRTDASLNLYVTLASGSVIAAPVFTGPVTINVPAIAATPTDGVLVQNVTPATLAVPVQYAPRQRFCGTAWKSDVTAASQTNCWSIGNRPATGAAATTSSLVFASSLNDGAYSDLFTLNSGGQALFSDGTALLPSIARATTPTLGFYFPNAFGFAGVGAGTTSMYLSFGAAGALQHNAASLMSWVNTTNAATGTTDLTISRQSAGIVQVGTTAANAAGTLVAAKLDAVNAQLTAGSAAGVTTVAGTLAGGVVTKYTIATTAFVCNAVTCDVTLGTLPVNTRVETVDAAITTVFACASVCTSTTLSFILGKGAAGAEYLASWDADAAIGWFGDADAEMGTLLTRAAAIQGGTFSATAQAIVLRLTSGTGNVGNATITNLSTGVLVVRIKTTVMP
jgi:hypothetical protein